MSRGGGGGVGLIVVDLVIYGHTIVKSLRSQYAVYRSVRRGGGSGACVSKIQAEAYVILMVLVMLMVILMVVLVMLMMMMMTAVTAAASSGTAMERDHSVGADPTVIAVIKYHIYTGNCSYLLLYSGNCSYSLLYSGNCSY